MNLMRCTIEKNKITPALVFAFILLLNFCSIDFAFSYELEHYQEAVTEEHSRFNGDTHSENSSNSHDDEEGPFCCSTIKAIGITSQKIFSPDNLRNSSRFSDHFQFAFIEKRPQILLVWGFTRDPGPPGSILFKSVFLKATPSHAPPVTHSI